MSFLQKKSIHLFNKHASNAFNAIFNEVTHTKHTQQVNCSMNVSYVMKIAITMMISIVLTPRHTFVKKKDKVPALESLPFWLSKKEKAQKYAK